MEVDYLIVGQGISGTFLSYYLIKAGKKVAVINASRTCTASKVASGVINPVTGRRIVRTWRIEELLPFSLKAYLTLEDELESSLVKKLSVLDFHPSMQMKESFEKRLTEEQEYLHRPAAFDWMNYFNFHFDIGEIVPCLLVDINNLLTLWREKLQQENNLIEEEFSWNKCMVDTDGVTYKNITARKIICCEGVEGVREAIIASIPGLPPNHIYKQGISIVPWRDDLFWIGSSYEWNFTDTNPTPSYKERVSAQLKYWLKLPLEIVDHIASVRPANMERRPFVGLHPKFSAVGILNGMGTKGCSLAPFFAKQLVDHLVEGQPIYADADVKRFEKILARIMN